ncbi:MAG: DUF3616 domain-containing protein [gamma proteobacterium endosymbiont of Lamellibrachia anaximandri]|nr:DUF3616 domain-containing protein [gamma proteobacterium endosymbiont of Lamellibrachia anaximandri]MBL3616805.1 DUF3616 domain-containing protein [gamma proteobacterium endosymbiont of Lamellibrachia anaximandri]
MAPDIRLPEDIVAAKDVSALDKIGQFLVIGADEAAGKDENENYIQLLTKGDDGGYSVHKNILLFEDDGSSGMEMDSEGIAVDREYIYVIGSHSSKRKALKPDKKYKKNRKRLRADRIEDEKSRDRLYRIRIDADGREIDRKSITLRGVFKQHPVLKMFRGIASKENGIDIEGIATKDGWLYLGFRGPVFRGNYVPVMKLKFDDHKSQNDLLYVRLGGRGIRSIASVSDGFLILAGPVGDGDGSYRLYHWDGKDLVPGEARDVDIGKVQLLGEITPPAGGKAEGLAVMQEEDCSYHLLIAYDGVENLNDIIQRFRVPKPLTGSWKSTH